MKRPTRDDGLSVHKRRDRHDELEPPHGYTIRGDGLLAYTPERPEPTDDDRELVEEICRIARGMVDPPPEMPRLGMHPEGRKRLERAYETLMGRAWKSDDTHIPIIALVAKVIHDRKRGAIEDCARAHKALEPLTEPISVMDRDGFQTALVKVGATDDDAKRIAAAAHAVDLDTISFGGGGRSGGRTPEAWAESIVSGVSAPDRASKNAKKRNRRRQKDAGRTR